MHEVVKAALMVAIEDGLAALEPRQVALFRRIYPTLTEDNLDSALDLIERTRRKRQAADEQYDPTNPDHAARAKAIGDAIVEAGFDLPDGGDR